jgi:hypothetical protein
VRSEFEISQRSLKGGGEAGCKHYCIDKSLKGKVGFIRYVGIYKGVILML